MVSDFTSVGRWMLETFSKLWQAFGTWNFLGFAIIFFPVMRKLVKLFKSLVNTI